MGNSNKTCCCSKEEKTVESKGISSITIKI